MQFDKQLWTRIIHDHIYHGRLFVVISVALHDNIWTYIFLSSILYIILIYIVISFYIRCVKAIRDNQSFIYDHRWRHITTFTIVTLHIWNQTWLYVTVYNNTQIKGSFSCKRGFSLLNFERGLKKNMGCLILKLYVVIILY